MSDSHRRLRYGALGRQQYCSSILTSALNNMSVDDDDTEVSAAVPSCSPTGICKQKNNE